jgi:hypothetical protein
MRTSLYGKALMLIRRTHIPRQFTLYCLIALLTVACGEPAPPPAPLPTVPPLPAPISDTSTAALPALVMAEREASIQGNLPLLAALWAEDGRLVDGRGSVETSDDYSWAGRAAILDRYQLAVFPSPPPPLTPSELANATLSVQGSSATLVNDGDRWRFTLQEGRWWLQELVYSTPPR